MKLVSHNSAYISVCFTSVFVLNIIILLAVCLQVTQMKIKNNPFAKAFLGGNASER